MACISAVYEEAEIQWRSATVVSPTEKTKPTLLLDLEPSVKQRIGLANGSEIDRWRLKLNFSEIGCESEYRFWRCKEPWRSRGENRSDFQI